jgi:hypothetical protein
MIRMLPMRHRQYGATAIMFALTVLVLFGFMGLALDLAQAFNRKTELQNAADAAALAGAKELDGSEAGIDKAVVKAIAAAAANKFKYSVNVALHRDGITFSISPNPMRASDWVSIEEAKDNPGGKLFIRVDTSGGQTNYGVVSTNFMQVLSPASNTTNAVGVAVAGRFAAGVTPIGICAPSTEKYGKLDHVFPTGTRSELVEFGFRRGVAYDILAINPVGTSENKYLLNPVDFPSRPGDTENCDPNNNSNNTLRPYVCTGTAPVLQTLPSLVYVNGGMQANTFKKELNARFEVAVNPSCTTPIDANIREYPAGAAATAPAAAGNWMNPFPVSVRNDQTIEIDTATGKPITTAPSDPKHWGVLWTYNSAVQWAASPPEGGYTPFTTADWPYLYPVNGSTMTAVSYPQNGLYNQTSGNFFQAGGGIRDRRVLNVAIADCSTYQNAGRCNGTVQVLGVGRFFMQVRLDNVNGNNIFGEFAGLVPDKDLTSEVRLYK